MNTIVPGIEKVASAAREALKLPVLAEEKYEQYIQENLSCEIRERLPKLDRFVLKQVSANAQAAVRNLKQGRTELAEAAFAEVRDLLKTAPVFLETRLMCLSQHHAAVAFQEYAEGRIGGALEQVDLSLAADERLEFDFGYAQYQIHRIHMWENRARVFARSGRTAEAIETAGRILAFIASGTPPDGCRWNWQSSKMLRPEMVRSKFVEISCQAARWALNSAGSYATLLAALPFASIFGSGFPHEGVAEWHRLSSAYCGGHHAEFLETAPDFLARGRADYAPLWYAVVLNVVDLCQEFGWSSDRILAVLAEDPLVNRWGINRLEFLASGSSPLTYATVA